MLFQCETISKNEKTYIATSKDIYKGLGNVIYLNNSCVLYLVGWGRFCYGIFQIFFTSKIIDV